MSTQYEQGRRKKHLDFWHQAINILAYTLTRIHLLDLCHFRHQHMMHIACRL